jgi:Fic/DOC family
MTRVEKFIQESNAIEGILRKPAEWEIDEFHRFMQLETVTIRDLEQFVKVYQPGARLRDQSGLNVRVGNHVPLPGGPKIREALAHLLAANLNPFDTHIAYETLHPFTDGNGRSGRMLWAWQIGRRNYWKANTSMPETLVETVLPEIGFLHSFYYQTLSNVRKASVL